MRIKVLTCLSGVDYVRNAGDICEVEDAEAARLIDKGFAEPLGAETASVGPAENAAKPKGKSRVAKKNSSANG